MELIIIFMMNPIYYNIMKFQILRKINELKKYIFKV